MAQRKVKTKTKPKPKPVAQAKPKPKAKPQPRPRAAPPKKPPVAVKAPEKARPPMTEEQEQVFDDTTPIEEVREALQAKADAAAEKNAADYSAQIEERQEFKAKMEEGLNQAKEDENKPPPPPRATPRRQTPASTE